MHGWHLSKGEHDMRSRHLCKGNMTRVVDTFVRGADSVKLPRSMKIPTKAAALSLPMISLCFLTKLALWSLFDDGFTYIQSLKQVLHHINLVFHKIYIPLMSKMSSVIHLFLSFILISHFRFVFPTICRTWRLSCRVALLPCYPESAPRHLIKLRDSL